jgi:hypothetical protein
VTCIRELQREAAKFGRHYTSEVRRHGDTPRARDLAAAESEALRAIEAIHERGPCRCEECRPQVQEAS